MSAYDSIDQQFFTTWESPETLRDQAHDIKTHSETFATLAQDTQTEWKGGLELAYHGPEAYALTVAMDNVVRDADAVKDAAENASNALDAFADELDDLYRARRSVEGRINFFNTNDHWVDGADEVGELREEIIEEAWKVQGDYETAADSCKTMIREKLEPSHSPITEGQDWHSGQYTSWEDLPSEVREDPFAEEMDEILDEIEDEYEGDWTEWAANNEEQAAQLTQNELTNASQLPDGAEDLYELTLQDNTDPEVIEAISEEWDLLGPREQEALLLMFPAVFGNLNGVNFNHRGQANTVNVYGERHNLRQERDELEEAPSYERPYRRLADVNLILNGLNQAASALESNSGDSSDITILQLDTSSSGQVVAMQGEIHEDTEAVHGTVPGSQRDITGLERGLNDLAEVTDPDDPNSAGIYFQGWDTPPNAVLSNNIASDPVANQVKDGADALAGFNHALNQEIDNNTDNSEQVRTAYTGHSAGGVMLATASTEEYGVDADAITLIGTVGTGVGLEGREDLANEDMELYYLETRSDIAAPGRNIMPQYSENAATTSFYDRMDDLDAVRLETGLVDASEQTPEGRRVDEMQLLEEGEPGGGHSSYYTPGSTASQNIQAAAEGSSESFVPYVEVNDYITSGQFGPPGEGTSYRFEFGDHTRTFDTQNQAQIYAIDYITGMWASM